MTASLETLVVASYLFADEMAIPRPGPAGEITDAELVALAVAQAAMGVPSDRPRAHHDADRHRRRSRTHLRASLPPPAERWGTTPVPVWSEDRRRQDCDGSRPERADRLLIRPASGRQVGTGLSARTDHSEDTDGSGHAGIESRAKSTGASLATALDGTPTDSQCGNVP